MLGYFQLEKEYGHGLISSGTEFLPLSVNEAASSLIVDEFSNVPLIPTLKNHSCTQSVGPSLVHSM